VSAGSAAPVLPVEGPSAETPSDLSHTDRAALLAHPARTGVLAAAVAILALAVHPAGAKGAIAAFMGIVLVVVASSDLERRIIPNRVIVPSIAVALVARIAFGPNSAPVYVLAALAAFCVFVVLNIVTRNGIGMGDAKLVAFLGAGLGAGVVGAVAIAFMATFPFALGMLVRGGLSARKSTLPFGPFLAFGALVVLIVPTLLGLGGA
jgi:prepilin signal peptidase PulO-like enzyme (type II secretory pathway)